MPVLEPTLSALDADDLEDLDEAPDDEVQDTEDAILDQATAARSLVELQAEIRTLQRLEALALDVRRSGADTKWRELASLIGEILTPPVPANQADASAPSWGAGKMSPPVPARGQKLVLFTEHRDTLHYLEDRIVTLLGHHEAVVLIHGGMGRDARLKAQESFKHDPVVRVLLATDAAGRGHQSAAGAPDGELRPAVEPEPP